MVKQGSVTACEDARWSGPDGYTLLSYQVDFRRGGASCLRVALPDGRDELIEGVSLEIVEPERVVFANEVNRAGAGLAGTKVTFRRA